MFSQYFFFLLKLSTVFIFIFYTMRLKKTRKTVELVNISSVDQYYFRQKVNIGFHSLNKKEHRLFKKSLKKKMEIDKKSDQKIVYVIDFFGDVKASQLPGLIEEVNTILLMSKRNCIHQVVICLESSGGTVNGYGLATDQILRLKKMGIKTVVCVDKVAASGGYMMASAADQIFSSPFAILGSIGVVSETPNVNKLLDKLGINVEVHTAGDYKRTLTILGKNTDQAREKVKDNLNRVHSLFKKRVQDSRPSLNLEAIANGDYWFGEEALNLKLVDGLLTSDEYLLDLYCNSPHRILKLKSRKQLSDCNMNLRKFYYGIFSIFKRIFPG